VENLLVTAKKAPDFWAPIGATFRFLFSRIHAMLDSRNNGNDKRMWIQEPSLCHAGCGSTLHQG